MRNAQNLEIIPTKTMTAVDNDPPVKAGEVDHISHC